MLTYRKCYKLGQAASKELSISWDSFCRSDEWKLFSGKLNAYQVYYISRGFTGQPFADSGCSEDVILPFGKRKGQLMSTLPIRYIMYLKRQEWVTDWPCVSEWLTKNEHQYETTNCK